MAIVEDRKLLEKALDYVLAEDAGLYAEACEHAGIKPKAAKVEQTADVVKITDGVIAPEGSDLNTPPPAA